MAGKLSFSIAINLLTENFKRGTNSVKNGFRAMQMQVLTFAAALGAGGLGLSGFVSQLITVARETSRVTTALKNVSGSLGQFADNQRFLLDMAKKYGLEINALTGNFAKFTAASQVSGMSMSDQRKIFESVSRACTAFGMSADDSNGVFLALSQMMSKGKISSEELRLQMGERLPVALQAMAKAAGVSVGGLDKLMKQGKLMSADVLPRFAAALNEMIPNVDTNNLETSVNHLKNAFTEFTKGTNIQSAYKGIIDWLTKAVESAGENIKNIVIGVVAVISGLIANAVAKTVRGWGTAASQMEAFSQTANNRLTAATAKRVAAEQALEKAKLQQALAVGSQRIAAAEAVAKAEARLATATAAEVKAQEVAKAAAAQAAAVAASGAWGRAYTMMKIGVAKLVASLSAMWNAFAPMIIVSAIVAIIGKLKEMYDESKRIKNIFSDYKKESQISGYTQEVVTLKQQLKIMNDKKQSQENINAAQAQLQKMLGGEYKTQQDLNTAVLKRVELLKEAARAEYHSKKLVEFEEKNKELASKIGIDPKKAERLAKLYPGSKTDDVNEEYYRKVRAQILKESGGIKITGIGEFDRAINEISQNLLGIADSSANLEKSTISTNKLNEYGGGGGAGDKDKQTPLQKAEEKYAQSLRELDAKAEVEKMSKNAYNEALDKLNASMYIEAKASGDKNILQDKYFKNLQEAVAHPLYNKGLGELEELQKKHSEEEAKLTNQYKSKLLTEKEYQEELRKLLTETTKAAGAISGVDLEAQAYIAAMQFNAKMLTKQPEAPKLEKRDTTYDYKKSKSDIAGEELEVAKKNLEILRNEAKALGVEMTNGLADAIKKIPDLEQALKVATVMEDVKKLREELNEGIYSGMKDVASSADRLVSAFQNLDEVFDPESEASGWERLMAVWNLLTNVVDSFMSICKMVESLTELTSKLTAAKEAETLAIQGGIAAKTLEATTDTTVTGVKVANSAIKQTADVAEASTSAATAITEVGANTAKGVSAAGASAASLPFPANLVAIGAAIAAAVALFASIPKFETGGIVGGNSYSGDKILARLNSGELILNKRQQSRLSDAIDSQKTGAGVSGVSVSGTSKVRGADIYLSLSNYIKRTGKKSPWK